MFWMTKSMKEYPSWRNYNWTMREKMSLKHCKQIKQRIDTMFITDERSEEKGQPEADDELKEYNLDTYNDDPVEEEDLDTAGTLTRIPR